MSLAIVNLEGIRMGVSAEREDELISVKEAARMLDCSIYAIYRLLNKGVFGFRYASHPNSPRPRKKIYKSSVLEEQRRRERRLP